jgi:hypothetical protein
VKKVVVSASSVKDKRASERKSTRIPKPQPEEIEEVSTSSG